jgi:hypothetical protein
MGGLWDYKSTPDATFGSAGRTEPDIRQEFNNFLDGTWQEISKKQPALLRKMRRDSEGNKIQCPCVDSLTGEPDKDVFCPFCHGEMWIWDEMWVDVYSVELGSDIGKAIREEVIKPGLMNVPLMVFYMRSSVPVTPDDKVVEMIRGEDGKPIKPYKRAKLYRISAQIDLRSDNGRLEYWKLDCYAEERKFLNGLDG